MRILCGAPGQSVLDPLTRDARNSGSPIGEINAAQRYPTRQDLRTSEGIRTQFLWHALRGSVLGKDCVPQLCGVGKKLNGTDPVGFNLSYMPSTWPF